MHDCCTITTQLKKIVDIDNLAAAFTIGSHREVRDAIFLHAIQCPNNTGGNRASYSRGDARADAARGSRCLRRVLAFAKASCTVQGNCSIQILNSSFASNLFSDVAKDAAGQLVKAAGFESNHFNNIVEASYNICTVTSRVQDSAGGPILAL